MAFFSISRVFIFVAGAVGCGSTPPGDGDDTGSSAAASSGGASMSETGEPTTAGPTTGGDASTTGGSNSESATGTSSTGEASTGEGSTTGALACTLAEQACALAGQLGDYMDCGQVDPWNDDAAAWQAAHDCALAAASGQQPFKLITVLQGIDSDVGQAYVGQAARSYALSTLFFDSDPCGGGGCGPVVQLASCTALTAVMDCVVEPGNVCLGCDGQGEPGQVCGPE